MGTLALPLSRPELECFQRLESPRGVSRGIAYAELDGERLAEGEARVALLDDDHVHKVRVIVG